MMVTCHSNTLASSTKPALNPSMGFRASSARRNAASAAARGRGSPGKARRTPRRQRSRAARPPRRSSVLRAFQLLAQQQDRLLAPHLWPAAVRHARLGARSCLAVRLAAVRAARRGAGCATTRCCGGGALGCCGTRCREHGGRRRDASTRSRIGNVRCTTAGGPSSVACFLFPACAARLDLDESFLQLLVQLSMHPVQGAVSLPAPSLRASDASPPVGLRRPRGRKHAGLLGRRVGVCAVCGGEGPRQRSGAAAVQLGA